MREGYQSGTEEPHHYTPYPNSPLLGNDRSLLLRNPRRLILSFAACVVCYIPRTYCVFVDIHSTCISINQSINQQISQMYAQTRMNRQSTEDSNPHRAFEHFQAKGLSKSKQNPQIDPYPVDQLSQQTARSHQQARKQADDRASYPRYPDLAHASHTYPDHQQLSPGFPFLFPFPPSLLLPFFHSGYCLGPVRLHSVTSVLVGGW